MSDNIKAVWETTKIILLHTLAIVGFIVSLMGGYIKWKDYVTESNCAVEELAPVMIDLAFTPFILLGLSVIFLGAIFTMFWLFDKFFETKLGTRISNSVVEKTDKVTNSLSDSTKNFFDKLGTFFLIILGVAFIIATLFMLIVLLVGAYQGISWLITNDFCL